MKIWIYADGRQQGPFELEELLDKPVTESTKVWYEGLPKWYPAGYLDEMRPLFDGTLARQRSENATADTVRATEENIPDSGAAEPVSCQDGTPQEEPDTETAPDGPAPGIAPEPQFRRRIPDEPCPPTYLGWTIFLTICCCSPLSVASLVTAILTSSYYNSGNMRKARNCSEATAWLIMISIALGFFSFFLWDIFF